MAAMCRVLGWDCCGRLNISRDRNSLCRHADQIRHPASPSPWADKTLLAAQMRVGWIPAQGRCDGIWDRPQ
jgi:hypothetical protein